MKQLLFLFIITFFISCNNTEDKFIGIWMGDRTNFYNPKQVHFEKEIENISLTQALPILLDFQKNNILTLKIFGGKTFKHIKWNIENDSILIVNNINYKINKITKDTISINLFSRAESFEYKVYRIKNKEVKLDSISTINKLVANIWSITKKHSQKKVGLKYENHIEYFKNNTRLLKYTMPASVYNLKNTTDSILNIEIDRWAIGKYKDYLFISKRQNQLAGTLPYSSIFQITKINDSELSIYRPQSFDKKHPVFYKSNKVINTSIKEKRIIGIWKSYNSKNKSYSRRQIQIEESEKYKGDLFYNFKTKKLFQYGIKADTVVCNWYLNKDKTILFYEYSYEIEEFKGITVYASEIKNFNENFLELNLFSDRIYNSSNYYLLNINQKFKKIENH